jgi:hypothetical protein
MSVERFYRIGVPVGGLVFMFIAYIVFLVYFSRVRYPNDVRLPEHGLRGFFIFLGFIQSFLACFLFFSNVFPYGIFFGIVPLIFIYGVRANSLNLLSGSWILNLFCVYLIVGLDGGYLMETVRVGTCDSRYDEVGLHRCESGWRTWIAIDLFVYLMIATASIAVALYLQSLIPRVDLLPAGGNTYTGTTTYPGSTTYPGTTTYPAGTYPTGAAGSNVPGTRAASAPGTHAV